MPLILIPRKSPKSTGDELLEPVITSRATISGVVETYPGGFVSLIAVELLELNKPKNDWKSIKEIIEAGYAHEQHITKCIADLWELAEKTKELQARSP